MEIKSKTFAEVAIQNVKLCHYIECFMCQSETMSSKGFYII